MARRTRASTLDPDVRLLAALADPTRLAIVRQLAADTETCACDFTSCCDVGQPTVSHHLRVLREAGVVRSERRGQWIFYRLAPDVAERLGAIARGLIPGGLIPVSDLRGRAAEAHAATLNRRSALRLEQRPAGPASAASRRPAERPVDLDPRERTLAHRDARPRRTASTRAR